MGRAGRLDRRRSTPTFGECIMAKTNNAAQPAVTLTPEALKQVIAQKRLVVRTNPTIGERNMRKKTRLKLVSPATQNRTVMPIRRPNAVLRTREYLTEAEITRLMKAASNNRHGH